MRKFLYILCFGLLLTTCDDGDVFEVTLDFSDEFKQCGSLVFFKTNQSSSESLSIQFGSLTMEDILEVDDTNVYENSFPLGGSNVFNYRSYGRTPSDNFFCNDVPPSNLQIERDEISVSGDVFIRTVLVEDDNDGIPAEFEDDNLDGDNDPDTNPTDTDSDGIPDYLDADDDGDNVLTIDEIDNSDGDNDPTTNPKNTDANSSMNPDTTPDYLDTDDDGDGVLTRDEEGANPPDNDPTNDITIDTNLNPEGIPDYLNDQFATTEVATGFRTHKIKMIYTVTVIVTDISLTSIRQQTLDFGTLNNSGNTPDLTNTERVEATDFN